MIVMNDMENAAYKEVKLERNPWIHDEERPNAPKIKIPEELTCPVCKDILNDAVMMSCCAEAACDECARDSIISSEGKCPLCQETASPEDVIPYRLYRDKVDKFQNQTGYTKQKKVAAPVQQQQPSSYLDMKPTLPDIFLPDFNDVKFNTLIHTKGTEKVSAPNLDFTLVPQQAPTPSNIILPELFSAKDLFSPKDAVQSSSLNVTQESDKGGLSPSASPSAVPADSSRDRSRNSESPLILSPRTDGPTPTVDDGATPSPTKRLDGHQSSPTKSPREKESVRARTPLAALSPNRKPEDHASPFSRAELKRNESPPKSIERNKDRRNGSPPSSPGRRRSLSPRRQDYPRRSPSHEKRRSPANQQKVDLSLPPPVYPPAGGVVGVHGITPTAYPAAAGAYVPPPIGNPIPVYDPLSAFNAAMAQLDRRRGRSPPRAYAIDRPRDRRRSRSRESRYSAYPSRDKYAKSRSPDRYRYKSRPVSPPPSRVAPPRPLSPARTRPLSPTRTRPLSPTRSRPLSPRGGTPTRDSHPRSPASLARTHSPAPVSNHGSWLDSVPTRKVLIEDLPTRKVVLDDPRDKNDRGDRRRLEDRRPDYDRHGPWYDRSWKSTKYEVSSSRTYERTTDRYDQRTSAFNKKKDDEYRKEMRDREKRAEYRKDDYRAHPSKSYARDDTKDDPTRTPSLSVSPDPNATTRQPDRLKNWAFVADSGERKVTVRQEEKRERSGSRGGDEMVYEDDILAERQKLYRGKGGDEEKKEKKTKKKNKKKSKEDDEDDDDSKKKKKKHKKDKKAKREEEEEREEKEEVEEKKVGDGEEKEVESLPEKNLSAPLVSYESQDDEKEADVTLTTTDSIELTPNRSHDLISAADEAKPASIDVIPAADVAKPVAFDVLPETEVSTATEASTKFKNSFSEVEEIAKPAVVLPTLIFNKKTSELAAKEVPGVENKPSRSSKSKRRPSKDADSSPPIVKETETKVEESSPLRMELSPHKNTLDYFEPDNPLVKNEIDPEFQSDLEDLKRTVQKAKQTLQEKEEEGKLKVAEPDSTIDTTTLNINNQGWEESQDKAVGPSTILGKALEHLKDNDGLKPKRRKRLSEEEEEKPEDTKKKKKKKKKDVSDSEHDSNDEEGGDPKDEEEDRSDDSADDKKKKKKKKGKKKKEKLKVDKKMLKKLMKLQNMGKDELKELVNKAKKKKKKKKKEESGSEAEGYQSPSPAQEKRKITRVSEDRTITRVESRASSSSRRSRDEPSPIQPRNEPLPRRSRNEPSPRRSRHEPSPHRSRHEPSPRRSLPRTERHRSPSERRSVRRREDSGAQRSREASRSKRSREDSRSQQRSRQRSLTPEVRVRSASIEEVASIQEVGRKEHATPRASKSVKDRLGRRPESSDDERKVELTGGVNFQIRLENKSAEKEKGKLSSVVQKRIKNQSRKRSRSRDRSGESSRRHRR